MTLLKSAEQDRWSAAAVWFARLQGDPAFCDWKAFQTWLEASPGHRQAYADVEALWLDLDLVAADSAMVESGCRDRRGSPRRAVDGLIAEWRSWLLGRSSS